MMGNFIPMKLANRNCTVNGKPLKQVEEELTKLFEENCFKQNDSGFPYLDIDTKMDRLTEVVGLSNFTVIPFPLPMEEIRYTAYPVAKALEESNQRTNAWRANQNPPLPPIELSERDLNPHECVTFLEKIITAIVIYSDEGEPAIVKYGYGASEHGFATKSTGHITNPDNTPDTAFSDGKKRACGALGIGEKQLKAKKKEAKAVNGSGGRKSNNTDTEYRIRITDQFTTVGKGYKAPAVILRNNAEETVFLVVWEQGIKSIEQVMPMSDFVKKIIGKELTIYGTTQKKTIRGTEESQLILNSVSLKN